MRPIRLLAVALALLAAPLGACEVLEAETGRIITLYVAGQTATCMGMVEQQCLLVRQEPDQEWQFFYDGIRGFTYEPGYLYTLQVLRRHVPNPPADGSSAEYVLVRVVEKTPVGVE
ncbi:MAG TPA: DUF4377 domain-containing protein [Longimicrobium sp.]|nr:DUF4377 domain-containing protein [Longimicrobium sp.]